MVSISVALILAGVPVWIRLPPAPAQPSSIRGVRLTRVEGGGVSRDRVVAQTMAA